MMKAMNLWSMLFLGVALGIYTILLVKCIDEIL